MQYTENYQMYVPEENDQYNIVHWNSNVAKIDKELHDNSVAINNEGVARKTAVSNEATARDNADKKLQANITAEESARKTAVSNEATARQKHEDNKSNPHAVTKAQVGLGNCDNTADVNKNVKTATKLATARTLTIQDASATNSGAATSFDGSGNVAIRLPSTIKANITGNVTGSSGSCTGTAAYATKLGDGTASYTYQQIKNAFVCPFPVGACYIQFPLQSAPSSLWAGTTWVELALGGAFLRATGGDAREFGSQTSATGGIQPQGEGLPNLYGHFTNSQDGYEGSTTDGKLFSRLEAKVATNSHQGHGHAFQKTQFNAHSYNSIYGASNHVTPVNITVRVWKRTA